MTTTNNIALVNINPLTVEVPPSLLVAFTETCGAIETLEASTLDLRRAAQEAGFELSHLSAPTKESAPEHRYNYAIARRMAAQRKALFLGVTLEAFEPVFSEAVESKTLITIGDETKTRKAWQSALADQWKRVKDAWAKSIRQEVEDAKAVTRAAEAALKDLLDAANKTKTICDAQEAEVDAVHKQLMLFQAEQAQAKTAKEKAMAAAKVKMAEDKLEEATNVAQLAEEADTQALLAVKVQEEVINECKMEVQEKVALLPASRGATERKSDLEKAIAKLDALIVDLSASDGTGYGSADLADAVYNLKMARIALNNPAH